MKTKKKYLPHCFDCSGKTALITGAAGLLGQQHAEALLKIGANLVVTDINYNRLEKMACSLLKSYPFCKIYPFPMDVSQKQQIDEVSRSLSTQKIRIDILINNAALDPKVNRQSQSKPGESRLENFSLHSWNKEIEVGLTGAFLCTQIFGKKMSEDGKGGVILNIGSDLSLISPDQRIYQKKGLPASQQPVKPPSYSVIKSGLVGLTRYTATYWRKQKVRANCLSPGGIETGQPREFVKKLTSLIPMGRMAKSHEYHGAVQFLCSDASTYLTGQNIVMDGGRTVW